MILMWMASLGISASLFAVRVYYLEVGHVGFGIVVGNDVFVNSTAFMTIVFFYSIFQISAGFSYVWKLVIFF